MKTERLSFKVLASQKAIMERMAQAEGEPIAVVMRRLIRAEAQRRGLWPTTPASETEEEVKPDAA